jgi:hypothetical protein
LSCARLAREIDVERPIRNERLVEQVPGPAVCLRAAVALAQRGPGPGRAACSIA